MEYESIEYFGMGWENVMTACAAATLPREKDTTFSRRLKGVHWCRDRRSNTLIQVMLAGAAAYAKAK